MATVPKAGSSHLRHRIAYSSRVEGRRSGRWASHRAPYAAKVSWDSSGGRQSPPAIEASMLTNQALASAASGKVCGAIRRCPSGAK